MDKIDESYRLSPCSLSQQQLIEKIQKDFPDSKGMLEYEDYLKEPTVGNASSLSPALWKITLRGDADQDLR